MYLFTDLFAISVQETETGAMPSLKYVLTVHREKICIFLSNMYNVETTEGVMNSPGRNTLIQESVADKGCRPSACVSLRISCSVHARDWSPQVKLQTTVSDKKS